MHMGERPLVAALAAEIELLFMQDAALPKTIDFTPRILAQAFYDNHGVTRMHGVVRLAASEAIMVGLSLMALRRLQQAHMVEHT